MTNIYQYVIYVLPASGPNVAADLYFLRYIVSSGDCTFIVEGTNWSSTVSNLFNSPMRLAKIDRTE